MSLYREFRPRSLSEMTGQSSIIKTIKNQIETRNISHAYIFSGPRGIGKTSIAKILSRAVNCERYDEFTQGAYHGEIPCNECQTCKDILSDMSMDVIEMDAASNNGVDDIRAINDMVKFPPSSARYKVIIIDEVHMLTKSAFNALLKTLEEPPSYMIFILATTEVNRIPATVLSRCQRYDFKKMTEDELFERLEHVCKTLNKPYDQEALRLIATRSEGAMRDALSILDQCLSYSDALTEESVLYSLSLVSERFLLNLFEALEASEFSALLNLLKSTNDNGFDPKLLLDDFSKFLYDFTRFVIEKKNPGFSEATMGILNTRFSDVSVKKLVYFQQKLLFSSASIKTSPNIWIGLECLFLDMAAYRFEHDTKALELRISELEHKLQALADIRQTPVAEQIPDIRQTPVAEQIPDIKPSEVMPAQDEVLSVLLDGIPRRLPHLYLPIKHSSIAMSDGILYIGIGNEYDFMVPTLNTTQNISEILKLLKGMDIHDIKFDYKNNVSLFSQSSSEAAHLETTAQADQKPHAVSEKKRDLDASEKEEQVTKVEEFFRKITESL